jgi:ABC-type Mn2+/Zn2+ transport system permease subunit
MQEPDRELEGWQREWRAQETVPPDLARAVEAGTRKLRRGRIGEILVTIVMGGGILGWAIVSRRAEVIVLAIAVWILLGVAWVVSTLLHRGLWQPVTATTAAFVEVSILRCERSLQAIWIQAVLYIVILAFDLVWLYYYRGESNVREFLMRPAVVVVLTVVTPAVAAAAVWYRRRLLRELKNLIGLRRGG